MKLSPAHETSEGFERAASRSGAVPRVGIPGSHIILQTEEPGHQRLAVPDHTVLRIGTLNSILRAVSGHKGIERELLLQSFH